MFPIIRLGKSLSPSCPPLQVWVSSTSLRGYPENFKPRGLCETLTGACRRMISGMPMATRCSTRPRGCGMAEYLPPPLPSTLYTRNTMCWIP